MVVINFLAATGAAPMLQPVDKNRSIATLRILGGHPALDLANTVSARGDPPGRDLLAGPAELLDWAGRIELAAPREIAAWREAPPALLRAALGAVLELREALYRIFSAQTAGHAPPDADMALLQELAREAAAGRTLRRLGAGFAWQWQDDEQPRGIARRIALAAVELLVGDRLGRVKECQGRRCGWLFLDASRNGQRRWCADDDCGVASRVRQHRARQQHAPREGMPGTGRAKS
jgi:predicted RNA-binding Zn ribbon-like protein